jgi:hypothetical protein
MWGQLINTESTRSALPPSFISFTDSGLHRAESPSLLPCCDFPSAEHNFSTENKWKMKKGSNGDEKLQIIYRWKAHSVENILE